VRCRRRSDLVAPPSFLHSCAVSSSRRHPREATLPTLFRLLVFLGFVAAAIYGAMIALVTFVHPQQHEITQTVVLPKTPR
jgi:hypothetical protein